MFHVGELSLLHLLDIELQFNSTYPSSASNPFTLVTMYVSLELNEWQVTWNMLWILIAYYWPEPRAIKPYQEIRACPWLLWYYYCTVNGE